MAAESTALPPETRAYPRVCLTTMARTDISLACHMAIVGAMTTGHAAYHLCVEAGPYLDDGRNKCIGNALAIRDAEGAVSWDWHLFIDSDIEFTMTHLETLFLPTRHPAYNPARYPVLGGIYTNPFNDDGVPGEEASDYSGFFGPVAYEWTEVDNLHGELAGIPTPTFRRLAKSALATRAPVNEAWNPPGTDASPSPICAVDAIGTGFLAIHSSLLHTMYEHYGEPLAWFDEPVRGGIHYGEDMGFALRCRDLGYPVLAHRGVTPLHHKITKLL